MNMLCAALHKLVKTLTAFLAFIADISEETLGEQEIQLMNYAYSLLEAECIRAINSSGLDVHVGCGFGRRKLRRRPLE